MAVTHVALSPQALPDAFNAHDIDAIMRSSPRAKVPAQEVGAVGKLGVINKEGCICQPARRGAFPTGPDTQSRLPNTEEDRMSIVVRYAPVPSSAIEHYDGVMRRQQQSGEVPANGFEYQVAFFRTVNCQ